MGLLGWVVLGLIAGWLAQVVTKERAGSGCRGLVVTTVIGIGGAAIGGFIGTALGWGEVNSFDIRSLLLAFLGAVLLLLALGAVRSR